MVALFDLGFDFYLINAAIAAILFFLFRSLIRRRINRPKNATLLAGFAALFAAPLVYVTLVLSLISVLTYYPDKKFDAEAWKHNAERRYEMSHDLIESNILIGKNRQEVLQLLGGESSLMDREVWIYFLGHAPGGLNIDPDILEIVFENGVVVSVRRRST